MQGFLQGSGMSVLWFNHWLLAITGTVVLIAAASITTMLMHRLGHVEVFDHMWIVGYVLFVVMMVVLFLGFLNHFWRVL